jgi:hypothetical protein
MAYDEKAAEAKAQEEARDFITQRAKDMERDELEAAYVAVMMEDFLRFKAGRSSRLRSDLNFLDSLALEHSAGYDNAFKMRHMINHIEKNHPPSVPRARSLDLARKVLTLHSRQHDSD